MCAVKFTYVFPGKMPLFCWKMYFVFLDFESSCTMRKKENKFLGLLFLSVGPLLYGFSELLLTIQWFLERSPCREAAATLRREIERYNVSFQTPSRYAFFFLF